MGILNNIYDIKIIVILHSSENEFPKTIFTEETEFHHNPTLFLIEETQDDEIVSHRQQLVE